MPAFVKGGLATRRERVEYSLEGQPFLPLALGHEEGIEHAHALGQHGHLQPEVILEVVQELLQRLFALDLKAVPQRELPVVVLQHRKPGPSVTPDSTFPIFLWHTRDR